MTNSLRSFVTVALLLIAGVTATVASSPKVGGLVMKGDAKFDSDSIASAELQERRWLSYPGGRLCLNPATAGKFEQSPMGADLALNIGGYLGTGVLRLDNVVDVRLAEGELSVARTTTWYPYQIQFQAKYANGAEVTGCDFFTDANSTLVRSLVVRGSKTLVLGGKIAGANGARWDAAQRSIVVEDAKYAYALRFGSAVEPTIGKDSWSVQISDPGNIVMAFGFAAASEGSDAAIARARRALARPVNRSLAAAKATMDAYLRKVPQPTRWGIESIPAHGVTPERQRQAYYAAWTLVIQSLMNPFPENPAYPFPQMSVGKASLWAHGELTSPATCGWESFMGLQWFSFLEPATCWKAYEGIMSRVDEAGKLGGESLPSRKAQTAWILHQQKPNRTGLKAVYPAIKRYLLWREQNPRWIFPGNDATDEKDIEFVVSWLFDVDYAVKIARELGLPDDVRQWQAKSTQMRQNLRAWFFSDPAKLHQFYFADRKVYHTKERPSDRPIMTLTALCLKDLPADMVERLQDLLREIHRPENANDGFAYTKYADNNLDAYGMVDHGMAEAKPFIEVFVRDSIRAGEFSETLELGAHGELKDDGVRPSLFNALNIIEFTWMLNGVRYESGTPTMFEFPKPITKE